MYKINAVSGTTITNSTRYLSEVNSYNYNDTGLYATQDEYGTSYYYRGDKERLNNNLIFGGFQWKIIRINGDGSIRIIYNGTEAQFTTKKTMNTTGSDTNLGHYYWNEYNDDAKYLGYMYGGAEGVASTQRNGAVSGAATYNETSSIVKIHLDNWYEENILGKPFENKIVDNLFCNDRQLQNEVGGGATGPGYGTGVTTYYAAYYRLDTNKNPTLRCVLKNDRFTVTDITVGNGALTYPVGLISADEASMAGLTTAANSANYLFIDQGYWVFSPGYMYSTGDAVSWLVHDGGQILTASVTNFTSYRPTISLSANVMVIGDGSASNPFKVI